MTSIISSAGFTATYFKSALGRFPTGVTVITAEHPDTGKPLGLTISSFSSVSLEPPMVLWTLTHEASSLPAFRRLQRYVIHVLSAGQAEMAYRFAKGPQSARFDGIGLTRAPGGSLMLADSQCAAWFECHNSMQHEAGDHTIFVGQVEHCSRQMLKPLVYHSGNFGLTPTRDTKTES